VWHSAHIKANYPRPPRPDKPMAQRKSHLPDYLTVALVLVVGHCAYAQQTALHTPETIVSSFVKTETELREALKQHTFKRDVVLQTIGPKGRVNGQYIRNSEFLFDDILDTAKYRFTYGGDELLDGKRAHVLTVEPAVKPNPHRMSERFFRGSIWIDAMTFHMVKVKGKVEPQGKQRFPEFQTWREPVNSSLSFPTRTEADDVLHFPDRSVNYRIRVRYYDYRLFASRVSVKEIDEPGN
jgi:hypothetical protein